MKRAVVIGLLMLLLAVGVVVYLTNQPANNGSGSSGQPLTKELLTKAIEVVALAENGKDYRSAITGWSELLQSRPDDRDLLLNQAVTVLKWIADTNSTLNSNSVTDPDKVADLEKQLQEAIGQADRIVARLGSESSGSESSGNVKSQDSALDPSQVLLETLYLETKSRTLDPDQATQLRKQAVEKLIAVLEAQPDQLFLVGKLMELEPELRADWPEVAGRTTDIVYRAWKGDSRNLKLLMRAGQGLVDMKDKRLVEVVEASLEITKPLLSMMPAAKQAQPDQLLPIVNDMIASGDWSKRGRVLSWLNVFLGTTAFQSDLKRLTPDVMALLNTSFLERWRSQLAAAEPSAAVSTKRNEFKVVERASLDASNNAANKDKPALVAWYDYGVAKTFDGLLVQGNQLLITEAPDQKSLPVVLTLPFEPKGIEIADLWTVDSPQRPRVKRNADGAPDSASAFGPNSHDTVQELILWNAQQLCIVSPDPDNGDLKLLTDIQGLSTVEGIERMTVIELDGDGDLDLLVSTGSGLKVLQNNGNRTFEDITQFTALPPAGWKPTSLSALDYDRDLDLDVVLTSTTAPHLAVMENILHSQMRFLPLDAKEWAADAPLVEGSLLEIDGNASWDGCWLGQASLSSVLTTTSGPGRITVRERSAGSKLTEGQYDRMHLGDIDIDGHLDMVLAGTGGLRLFYGTGRGLSEESQVIFDRPVQGLDIQDADGDGIPEILTFADGKLQEFYVQSPSQPNYVNVRIRGQNDNKGGRINHYGIGSTVEVWSEGQYQARVVQDPLTHFGLPGDQASDVRVIFNNGITQNVIQPKPGTLVEELQELKGSCPFVYGWNGQRFEMITDLLWNAPLGLQVARGQTLPDRRWEYLLLPGKLVQPKDETLELRVTEELWEVAYFDHLTLTAIDHPASVDVWTNEKVGPPQLAEPRLFTASHPIRPVAAHDGYGRDCLPLLAARNRQFVQAFQHQICQGLCETHSLELAFDPEQLKVRHDLRLVITGWMHPTDTSLNIGISQNPDLSPPAPPSLWAPDANGQFVCKQPFMGFPGGKPKTIVIDLQDVFTGDDTRLRIESSQEIYWDEAYLVANEPPVPVVSQSMPLEFASLHYRGFGTLMPRAADQPHWYDYQDVSQQPKWPPLEGVFTRYGDVRPQLQGNDDHIVVMGSGDEMVLRFKLPTTPLPDGWTRDYVLHSVGWDKDADLNTLEGQSSLPLPYAGMRAYPPGIEQQLESEAVWQLNQPDLVPRPMYREFYQKPKR